MRCHREQAALLLRPPTHWPVSSQPPPIRAVAYSSVAGGDGDDGENGGDGGGGADDNDGKAPQAGQIPRVDSEVVESDDSDGGVGGGSGEDDGDDDAPPRWPGEKEEVDAPPGPGRERVSILGTGDGAADDDDDVLGSGGTAAPVRSDSLARSASVPYLSEVIALPVSRRPLFPGAMQPILINDTLVPKALKILQQSGHSYIGAFFRQEAGKADGTAGAGGGENGLITDLGEIHQMGVLASVERMEPSKVGDRWPLLIDARR